MALILWRGFLSLRFRILLLTAMLGLAGIVHCGARSGSADTAQQGQTSPGQTSQGQASQGQASQDQASPNESSSRDFCADRSSTDPVPQFHRHQARLHKINFRRTKFCRKRSPIELDSSETLFSVLTALNSCGYDQDLTYLGRDAQQRGERKCRGFCRIRKKRRRRGRSCASFTRHTRRTGNTNRSFISVYFAGAYMDGPPHFKPRNKRRGSAAGCGGDYGFRYDAGTLLRQSSIALHLGAAS